MDVKIESMRMMRIQVENVRAIFDVQVGPFLFRECFLRGKLADAPERMTVGLPGKRAERGGAWVNLVTVTDADLMRQITEAARLEYQRRIDREIEHMVREQSRLAIPTFS